ncbi:hypothetical protein K492DRAFT_238215 [Lichtheimia hyalospora FSU 10163]|nr:hypothetical protein K492DRAFT_238215 [Lichtheimia hyalospora FSU 10163]
MNDYPHYTAPQSISPSATRDMKSVPLYQHDQIPYSSLQQTHQPKRPSEDLSSNPVNGDLQDVIFYYQSQPDMLRLILQSKVEEDRRRAEEAKLRAKELDLLMLQQQQQQQPQPSQQTPLTHITQTATPVSFDDQPTFTRRPTPDTLISDHRSPTTSISMGGASTHSDHSEIFSPINTSAAPAGPANVTMFPMDSYPPVSKPSISSSPIMPNNTSSMMDDSVFHLPSNDMFPSPYPSQPLQQNVPSSPLIQRYEPYYPHRPRRRREMQAVTKIVETREYPYADGYFWKNNGNTIQKKTGNKSVYYKCSNSVKGCPVNKTVTWKGNGDYLIKYRGEHLPDCGHVQRVLDM